MIQSGSSRIREPGRQLAERRSAALVSLVLLAACAGARQPDTMRHVCPVLDEPPAQVLCLADRDLKGLSARFTSDVQAAGGSQTAEGILLVRRPGAIRLKLFGPVGMTVHDAIWTGDASVVRGFIQRPMRGEPLEIELGPNEVPTDPESELSLALWSLFQNRCDGIVEEKPGEAGWLFVDPRSAHAVTRAVRVGSHGVAEELLVRKVGEPPRDEHLVARYEDFDCSGPIALPRQIELVSAERGWRAEVAILSQQANPELDEQIFQPPTSSAAR